ncbi:ly6/PLAUR domain-containing protein 3-like [Hyla sarda]|uniref:ly6/PLAUR domain-containing protein 3-like n=1 Tax=Hyla sarda TaxID=327740 RepID=UPI0024C21765|nr:ly6/PLAUR domain-containing protein 3-like [Hyla sarda]
MERMFVLSWRSTLLVTCLVFTIRLNDVTSQSLECFSCTDRGDGGCLPERAVNVSCSSDHDVCLESLSGIETSHNNHIILKKGCGSSVAASLDNTISLHGIFLYIKLHECNSSLCNKKMYLKNYALASQDPKSRVPNDEQCYSCIGKPNGDCSSSNAPAMSCYDSYSHCFDGNVAISIDNDTTLIPVKSCSLKYRCAEKKVTYGKASFEIKGACCSEELCNEDLSNITQLELPSLVVLGDHKEELPTTPVPAPWVTPTHTSATTKAMQREEEVEVEELTPNNTASSRSSNHFQDGHTNNTGYGLVYASWLISVFIYLS